MPGVPLLANMTEFGRTPFFTKEEFEDFGYKMVIWPVTSCGWRLWRRKNCIRHRERWRRAELRGPDADPQGFICDDRL
jgi:2-methylisocitrate lyase-like PEP mutase family enzyme